MRPSLVGHAAAYTLANVVSASIPFLMLPILARHLTAEEYGLAAMFSACVSLFGAFTGVNVHGAISLRYFDRDEIDFPAYIGSSLGILIFSTAVVLLAVALLMPRLVAWTHLPPLWLTIAVLVSGAQFVVLTQLAIWQSSRQPLKFGAMRLSQAALDAVGSLALVLIVGAGWQGRAGGIALAAGGVALAALLILRRSGWLKMTISPEYVRSALRFGLPLVPHTIGGIMVGVFDRILVGSVIDVAATGIYVVALQLGAVLGILTDSFNKAFAPWLMESLKRQDAERDRTLVRGTYLYFAVVLCFAAVASLAAPGIISLIAGPRFMAAAPLVGYVMFGFAFGGMYYMVANYIFFAGRTELLAVVTLAGGALDIALCYVLLRYNGVVGAAQAYMVSQVLIMLGAWWLASRCRPMPWRRALSVGT